MIGPAAASHGIVHRDPFAYCAHPHIARAGNGDWVLVFNRSMRRPFILHPPQDPHFHNLVMRSTDRGRSWSAPQVAPGYDWHGVECAGLTTLSDGGMLLNQWRFHWYPIDLARRMSESPGLTYPSDLARGLARSPDLDSAGGPAGETIFTWARGGGETAVHRSDDHGRSWTGTCRIATAPYSGGYGMRGAVELPGGELLLPLSDVPNYRTVFVVRSPDRGRTWGAPAEAAAEPGKAFEEPSLVRLANGQLLMLLRENEGRRMHRIHSDDDGITWSKPAPTPIGGYPPHLLLLPDGRLLCTFGWRQPDFGIHAVVSADGGETWDTETAISIRAGLPNKDLGYPATLLDSDGSLFTVYYGQDAAGVTAIMATRWQL